MIVLNDISSSSNFGLITFLWCQHRLMLVHLPQMQSYVWHSTDANIHDACNWHRLMLQIRQTPDGKPVHP